MTAPVNDTIPMPREDVNNLDEVVRELGIEDSDTTPADAVRELKAEIERLHERCAAYKGQIEAGAIAIERLRANRAATVPSDTSTDRQVLASQLETCANFIEDHGDNSFEFILRTSEAREIIRALRSYSPDSKSALVISKERIKTTVGLVLAKNKWPIHQTYDDAGLDYEEYEEFVGEVLALLLPSGK